MTDPGPVVINLPSAVEAPAYRDSLSSLSEFAVQDFDSAVAVAPREGAGATREYFKAERLCGDGDVLTDATWQPLREHPPRDHDPARTERLINWAHDYIAVDPTSLWRLLRALRACVYVLGSRLPKYLQGQMPLLFKTFPGASLWFVSTDRTLLARLSFLRTQLALELTPDIPLSGPTFDGLRLLDAHSLTTGVDFGPLHGPPLLAFSPGVVGYPMSCAPHALVLFLGQTLDLRKPEDPNWADIYRPRTLDRPETWNDPEFWDHLDPGEVQSLLPWWVNRLNVLYSHAADPTQFHDELARHDAAGQAAWLLTLERMLTDGILLLSDVRAGAVTRLQLAFDLLDKAEALLGYADSGAGFKDLLRRSRAVSRFNAAWSRLPSRFVERFRAHTQLAFDLAYEDIREHALVKRKTTNGMLVARQDPATVTPMPMDEYFAELVRAVRNSAHGLGRLLRGRDALLVATHDGRMPAQLTDLAALAMFALVADAEQLCAGTWW